MAYCRFGSNDIYLFYHVDNYICCCVCSLTPKDLKTIFTKGLKEGEHPLFSKAIAPCKECGGEGCESCCMHHDKKLYTYEEAIDHVREHIAAGDYVDPDVIPRLEREGRIEKYTAGTRARTHRAMRKFWKEHYNSSVKRHVAEPQNEYLRNRTGIDAKDLIRGGRSAKRLREMLKRLRERNDSSE